MKIEPKKFKYSSSNEDEYKTEMKLIQFPQ